MNDLRSFVVLQARLYEFLEQQDESTLQAIVSGAVRLAVLRADDTQAPASSVPREDVRTASQPASARITMVPSNHPLQAAQDLSTLASEHERRIYLNAAQFDVKGLRRVARLLELTGYSKLPRAKLIERLAGHGSEQNGPLAPRVTQEAQPSTVGPSTEPAKPSADVAAIASHLRETETEEEGAAYLHAQHLDRESLLAVAAELQLTRVNRLSQTELEKRVLKQAIGARRKFSGLRKW